MLRTENLQKIFRDQEVETIALQNINLNIAEGEFVAIMGPSGCGKTTLLNILGLIDTPTNGKYYFMGNDVGHLKERLMTNYRKGNIGFVFQNFNLIDELSIYENVELPLIYLKYSAKQRKQMVIEAIKKVELLHRSKFYPTQLSGGQQQKVAIARAIVANPKLILADEPTGNLDSIQGEVIMNLLSELNQQGVTIIMVTHSKHDADYSRRIINLFDGKIVNQNTINNEFI